ncbi:MAG TPA: beta-ketoacyl-ACP reductase [Lentisphaeria bacterium]|nr:MAG: beta-ketoacyl-ACP reductase [Lentisphaerae bacterium GWF2_49_21]HBC86267.1 beta-ketoacyl-ACP reductase [Lentisphaeria bacterium]
MKDRVALVTGGSRGIGRAIAIELGKAGAKVAICYKQNDELGAKVAGEINENGGNAKAFKADVNNSTEITSLFKSVKESFGPVEILVSNAGIIRQCPIALLSEQEWDEVVDTNLKGTFTCTRLAVRDMMRAKWGRIIIISSDAGRLGEAMGSHYAASKAGAIGFAKSAARELAPYNITVNAVTPGYIETDMTAGTEAAVRAKQIESVPARKMGSPQDVAWLVAFLASEKGQYITGQTISVDGGLFM